MKVLLVSPSSSTVYGQYISPPYPPLGLLYIAAVLEKDNEVKVVDYDADKMNDEKLKDIFNSFKPDLVGLTASTANINSARQIASLAKEHEIKTLLGGLHATMMPEECMNYGCFDFIVKGEGEITIPLIVENLDKDEFNIDGMWYKKNGGIIKNKDRPYIQDLDSLPFPARHLLENPDVYTPPDAIKQPVTPIMTSRGCPSRCTYCCTKHILGQEFRFRSPKNSVDEIEYVIKKYGVKEIHIMDDVFTYNKQRVFDFRDEVKKRDIDVNFVFANGLRADQVDKERLEALKDLGVISIGCGVESGNQQILNNIRKDIRIERVREAYKIAQDMGFQTWGFFILGLPGDNDQTIKETIKFAKELDVDFAKFLTLTPYPNSHVFHQLEEENLIDNKDYDNYGVYTAPVHHLKDLSAEDIVKWQKRAYRQFYLRPRKILQHLARMKSLTQLKYNLKSAKFILGMM
jgi:radical SAM superfamily enzyme YgiQ (UPF0313 family)|tara:strand:- start:11308 stop:12687 length:1380 start_codon:yes stop_codon:yes gene_type:complete